MTRPVSVGLAQIGSPPGDAAANRTISCAETPLVEILLSEDAPSPLNPLGVKGAGEGGTNACGAALATAVEQAIGRPGSVTELPMTPARVRSMLNNS